METLVTRFRSNNLIPRVRSKGKDGKEKEIVLLEIYKNMHELCLDQYGNYVIQVVIENWDDLEVDEVLKEFKYRGAYVLSENEMQKLIDNFTEAEELYSIISDCFQVIEGELMSYEKFVYVIEQSSTALGDKAIVRRVSVTVEENDGSRAAISGDGISNYSLIVVRSDVPLNNGDRVRLEDYSQSGN